MRGCPEAVGRILAHQSRVLGEQYPHTKTLLDSPVLQPSCSSEFTTWTSLNMGLSLILDSVITIILVEALNTFLFL